MMIKMHKNLKFFQKTKSRSFKRAIYVVALIISKNKSSVCQ